MIMSGAVAQTGAPVSIAGQGRRSSLTRSRIRAAWLFIAPSLIVLALGNAIVFRALLRKSAVIGIVPRAMAATSRSNRLPGSRRSSA